MANKRISELNVLTVEELTSADLLLVSDVTAQESKQLAIGELSSYLLSGGNLTGSFFGTASWAYFSQTASVLTGLPDSASYAKTASFALNGTSGGISISSSWASSSLSSSYANTSSWALNTLFVDTASVSTRSTFANSASYLVYSGVNNGTVYNAINAINATNVTSASYATTASFVQTSQYANYSLDGAHASTANYSISTSYALTAETANIGIITNIQTSASWASSSLSSITSLSSNNSNFSITSSYVYPNPIVIQNYGIFQAISQSNSYSQLDNVTIIPFYTNTLVSASVEAVGTIIAYYTSSILLNESVGLYLMNRATGVPVLLDSTPIYINIQGNLSSISASIAATITGSITGSINASTQGTMTGLMTGSVSGSMTGSIVGSEFTSSFTGSFTGSVDGFYIGQLAGSVTSSYAGFITGSISGSISTLISGAIKMPFNLMGQSIVQSGSYLIYISASSGNISIEPSRIAKFNVNSSAGSNLSVNTGDVLQFTSIPDTSFFTFTSTDPGGPWRDTAPNILITGSSKILSLGLAEAYQVKYLWTLSNLKYISGSRNTNLIDVGGMPTSIVTMSLANCGLTQLYSLENTSASILDCSTGSLIQLPTLASSMSYIDCSNNTLTTLPSYLPYGLKTFYCNGTFISQPPLIFPNSIVSMSFNSNPSLAVWTTALPTSLTSLDCSNCNYLTSLPTIPSNVTSLDVSNGGFTNLALDSIVSNLYSNGLNSGSLNMINNASLLSQTITKVNTMILNRHWTISYTS